MYINLWILYDSQFTIFLLKYILKCVAVAVELVSPVRPSSVSVPYEISYLVPATKDRTRVSRGVKYSSPFYRQLSVIRIGVWRSIGGLSPPFYSGV